MNSHAMQSKMRLSKVLFIAMVALCLVFMRATAEPGDEVAVEGEGEAMAATGPGAEAGAEVGESQVAQDIVRTQVASSRGPTRSQAPSKAGKSNKMKIAVVIGVILLLLAAGFSFGFLYVRPKRLAAKADANFDKMKEGVSGEYKFEKIKLGSDKKELPYLYNAAKLDDAAEAARVTCYDKLVGLDCATKQSDGMVVYDLSKPDTLKALIKANDGTPPDGVDAMLKALPASIQGATGNEYAALLRGNTLVLGKFGAAPEVKPTK